MEISSRNVVEGTARAPHRAMYKAMGLTDNDLAKPFVGVVIQEMRLHHATFIYLDLLKRQKMG